MAEPNTTTASGSAMDPITALWRDVWARSAASMPAQGAGAMPGFPGMPGAAGMGGASGAFMTPEAMRRMQGAFFEAMAQYAEQHMRTPQFLESMKKSMDQALQFRQQMDDFLKTNMSQAFESATGGANSEILGAIRQSTAQLQAQIAKLDARVSELESAVTGKPKAESEPKTAKKPGKK